MQRSLQVEWVLGMKAEITQDYPNTKTHSRIGEKIQIVRNSTQGRVWIRLNNGQEVTWPWKCLKIISESEVKK